MKKALLLLSFVHLLAACTNDIEILPNDESQKLIVNALINANKTNNAIFLALSGYHEPQVVKMEIFTFILIMYYRKQFRNVPIVLTMIHR